MKKSLLALAVAAVAASSVASAATVYDQDGTSLAIGGRIQAVAYSQDVGAHNDNAAGDATIQGSMRLNIGMRTQLTDNIAAFAFSEWDADDHGQRADNFNARDQYVGVDFGQFGQVQAGRFRDAVYQGVESVTDVFDDWGCDGQLGNDDRRDGMIMYSWSGWGVDFKAAYESAKDGQQVDGAWLQGETVNVKNGYSVSLGYTSPDVLFGPIAVKAGYGYVRFQDDKASGYWTKNDAGGYDWDNRFYDNYSQWAAALSWGTKASGPMVAVMYQARDFTVNGGVVGKSQNGYRIDDYTVQGLEAVLAYGFDCGVSIRAAWEWMNIDVDGANGADLDAYTLPVYINYQINPNFNVWAEARFDVGTDDDEGKSFDDWTGSTNFEENVYSVGARYTF